MTRNCARHRRKTAQRKSLIGSGDRSERIRTYNFPAGPGHRPPHQPDAVQDRRDHGWRHGELVTALTTEHQTEQLAALAGE